MTKIKNYSMNATYKNANEFNAIDIAKFIFAILVVAMHVSPLFVETEDSLAESINFFIQNVLGRLAVPFFFICSGFFVFKKTSENNLDFKNVKRHVIKILKIYAIWSAIYFFPIYNSQYPDIENKLMKIVYFIKDFIFSGIFGVGNFGHLWYLNATIFVSIIIYFLLKKKVKIKYIVIIAAAFYFVGLFCNTWYGLIIPMEMVLPGFSDVEASHMYVSKITSNGLLFGFMFMLIGVIFAYKNVNFSKRQSIIGFIVSFILMIAEIYYTKINNFAIGYSTCFFLVPTSFFLFSIIVNIRIDGKKQIYKNLRICSSLIYFGHIWVRYIFRQGIYYTAVYQYVLYKFIPYGCFEKWLFPIVLLFSVILSFTILWLSKKKGFRWLRHLYS